ncbi:MAG: GTPase HflX [Nitrospirae bacterium CG_4_9_14_3_um_filter_53_35]|nr:MAG: GTPase HflX [Nitrospirae bacterium CG2_30_53_67]PIS37923.1 MAG: GTPase HflX [Nitrospirae bacterium CG08_land_8_20_14_0_20_52_24]PIV85475.1 MAG: GTPase HflX [Nitrospirae bacterium CG17_big_fil_post_rev_8_21_14_2_50_50_9]PIW84136.1 MAG: GTPase HflX [Nitrospirae bacterium CG_4_8_14_3_um_filter_50_41]PIX85298.1 MAG: GTPase HflX [Nitrospirae bacterium CG_4_10_14_3_um_filter_53_41]PJA75157.1 MAG: GTPase HflX [Nitrospirae bacterium CG_4_9_14_3_um_filter_53_35]
MAHKKKIQGNTLGLKPSQIQALDRIYRRRIPPDRVITEELARYLTELSYEIGRQIGVLTDRKGNILTAVVGDRRGILIPDLSSYRVSITRLCGLRLIHTHLGSEPLTKDDLTDLSLLRLDLIAAITVGERGLPGLVHMAHLAPRKNHGDPWKVLPPLLVHQIPIRFSDWIQDLESEITRSQTAAGTQNRKDRAILIRITTGRYADAQDSIEELKELARTDGIHVLDTVIQQLPKVHPKFVMGEGKIKEIIISAKQSGADLIAFDQELTPGQARSIADLTDMRVIDRTQLILDIFAQHAKTREGKVQVELAQLHYLLPRLTERDSGLSRLTGGIGGRGPGETKLEISRRRTRERIQRLEKELKQINLARMQRRASRIRKEIPIISIVGYTNAGKSTLLNALTQSSVLVEDKLFATLDTAARRLRFPRERDVIMTDTVGFIRDLPEDLFGAFKATLDELHDADLLLHVVDLPNPHFEDHIRAVEKILSDLNLLSVPSLLIFNKIDLMDKRLAANLCRRYNAIPVSAALKEGLTEVTKRIEKTIWGKAHMRRAVKPGGKTAL